MIHPALPLSDEDRAAIEERLAWHLESKRVAASLACPDCISLCGEGVCIRHDRNAEFLEQDK